MHTARHIKVLGLALMAMFAFSAVAAASASAAPEWLQGGLPIAEEKAAKVDGLLVLHHKGGTDGTVSFHCEGSFDGTVGPEGKDLITKALNTKGEEVTKAKPLSCTAQESEQILCPNGAAASVAPVDLPWATQLLEPTAGSIFDDLKEDPTSKTGLPGYEVTCGFATTICRGEDRAHFDENKAGNALFLFLGELKAACTDNGEGTVLGHGEVLGFEVS